MKKKFLFVIAVTIFSFCPVLIFAQQTITTDIPGISVYVFNNGSSYGGGSNSLYAGKNGNTYRSYISWDNIRSYVPLNSQLTDVKFYITWGGNGHSTAQIEFRDFTRGVGYSQNYNNIGSGTLWDTKIASTPEYAFTQLTTKVQNSVNGGNNEVLIGIKNQNESSSDNYVSYLYNVSLRVTYLATQHVVTQVDENGSPFGQVGLWWLGHWENKDVPFNVTRSANQSIILESSQQFKTGTHQKYWKWTQNDNVIIPNFNDFTTSSTADVFTATFNPAVEGISIKNDLEGTGITGGNIKFIDPWYIDLKESSYEDSFRNRGMDDAVARTRESLPFEPDFNTVYQNGTDPAHSYQGIFLNEDFNIPDNPYYSVQTISTQTISLGGSIGTRDFYHMYWDYDLAKISLRGNASGGLDVVFKSADAQLTAVLKGHHLSNNNQALSDGSQHRLVRTDNGIYHLVYESMGGLWYTYSLTTDFNGAWHDEIGINEGKNPSISYYQNDIKIIYECPDGEEAALNIDTYHPDQNGNYVPVGGVNRPAAYPINYYGNAKPVITFNNTFTFVVYRKNSSQGLYRVGKIGSGDWSEDIIPGTNSNCFNPSVTCMASSVFLAYENFYNIYYNSAGYAGWRFNTPEEISSASGNNVNVLPCISLSGNNSYPFVSWIGSYSSTGIGKETSGSNGNIPPMVVARRRGELSWGSFFKSSSNVHSVSSNSTNNTTEQSVITWSEGTPPNCTSKWVRRYNDSYIDPHSLSSNGVESQVSNGTDFTNIGAFVLSTTTTPYDLPLVTTDFNQTVEEGHGTGKITAAIDLAYGREGIIGKNGVEFLFDVGDIFVEDTLVRFIPLSDTLYYTSAEELNNVVQSEAFHLSSNTDFRFTDYYYIMNPEAADTLLTENDLVNFKVELVDASTGAVVGTYDNITYTKYQLDEHNNVSYQVDCSNITAGDYYLRLVTSVQGEANYNLANFQHSKEALEKHNYNRVNFDGSKMPTTYDLSQNYPNPFNPTTTINYQVPQNSFVTLKVYDILGREVATLVNEQKNQGRYSVNFDASMLASGVYIYQIRANDFVSSKKMLFIK